MADIEHDAEPLRLRWNSLAGWDIVGISGLPGWTERDKVVEYVRADAYRGAVSTKITDEELDAAWSAWSERWVTSSGRDAMREALMTFARLRGGR